MHKNAHKHKHNVHIYLQHLWGALNLLASCISGLSAKTWWYPSWDKLSSSAPVVARTSPCPQQPWQVLQPGSGRRRISVQSTWGSWASMRCRSTFLAIKAPGVSDVVLPHVSVQPVGEVEEPGGILSQQICSPHSFWSEDTMRFGISVQNNFVLEKLQKNRESRPVVHADQDVRHHSRHLRHDPTLNLKHGK